MSTPCPVPSPSASGSDFCSSPSKNKHKRAPRGPSQRPTGRFTITEIGPSGAPIGPEQSAAKWRTTCGIIARSRVPLTLESWKKVDSSLHQVLVDDIHASFDIPEEFKDRVDRAALKVANKAWKEFKSVLRRDFIAKGEEPFAVHKWMDREMWTQFKEMVQTEEFKAKSEAAKALAAKNIHHHRLGSSGYAPKVHKWMEEEERVRLNEQPPPFPNIVERRVRNWLYARRNPAATSSDANLFSSQATHEVFTRLEDLSTQSPPCEVRRENDLLSRAIGTKEHPGRTRGTGVYATWRDAFPDDLHLYRNKSMAKTEREARERAALVERITNTVASGIEARIRALEVTMGSRGDFHLQPSPPVNQRSSQSSASTVDLERDITYPVDEILDTTGCKLMVRVDGYDELLEVATGMAYASNEGDLLHGVPIARGNAKVSVDNVIDTFKTIKLKFPPDDQISRLGQARGTFIQWPKRNVVLENRPPSCIDPHLLTFLEPIVPAKAKRKRGTKSKGH